MIALATRTRWVRISRTILIDLLNVLLDLVLRDTLLEDDDVLYNGPSATTRCSSSTCSHSQRTCCLVDWGCGGVDGGCGQEDNGEAARRDDVQSSAVMP